MTKKEIEAQMKGLDKRSKKYKELKAELAELDKATETANEPSIKANYDHIKPTPQAELSAQIEALQAEVNALKGKLLSTQAELKKATNNAEEVTLAGFKAKYLALIDYGLCLPSNTGSEQIAKRFTNTTLKGLWDVKLRNL